MNHRRSPSLCAALVCLATASLTLGVRPAAATEYAGTPSTYRALLTGLVAGDVLHLDAGTYPSLLPITDLNGREDAWITITGPESGAAAIFTADAGPCCDICELRTSSYVAIEHLTFDGNNDGASFGVNTKTDPVHHIRIDSCTFSSFGGDQQQVAISTKNPTWGWIIHGNVINGPGTGLYLGNSDGTDPFIGGLIEYNLIEDPIGYCGEIKWQQPRPTVTGMPTGPSVTVIRHNVFIKNDQASPSGDRPNLLVGGFPTSGAGIDDRYELYGNLFFHNPRESLLQASGRVSIHDNVFVDTAQTAIVVQNHDLPLKLAHLYNNTIFGAARGVYCGGAQEEAALVGNLIFATTASGGTFTDTRDNLSDTEANATSYVGSPSRTLGAMDFYPKAGQCQGSALDLSKFATQLDYSRDFNGTLKGGMTFRGAYAGEGTNPGWLLDRAIKGQVPSTLPGDGAPADGAGPADSGAADGGPADGGPLPPTDTPAEEGLPLVSDAGADSHAGKPLSRGLVATGCACDQQAAGGAAWLGLVLVAIRRSQKNASMPG